LAEEAKMSALPHSLENRNKPSNNRGTIRRANSRLVTELSAIRLEMEQFTKNNAGFVKSALTAEAQLEAMHSALSSVMKRLDKLEDTQKVQWNKTATVVSLTIAIASLTFTILSSLLK
jgi:hypothetical protein